MKERVMVIDGDIGEIISWDGAGIVEWLTVIDDRGDTELDCTVIRAEAVIMTAREGWTFLGETEDGFYVRMDEYYKDAPNPYQACKPAVT